MVIFGSTFAYTCPLGFPSERYGDFGKTSVARAWYPLDRPIIRIYLQTDNQFSVGEMLWKTINPKNSANQTLEWSYWELECGNPTSRYKSEFTWQPHYLCTLFTTSTIGNFTTSSSSSDAVFGRIFQTWDNLIQA